MHKTALDNAQKFFDRYGKELTHGRVVDVGSQDINGSLRQVCPGKYTYTGIDFVPGKNVEIVLEDPYKWPLPDNHADIVVSSSCFEHSQFFWMTFLEMVRITKKHGYIYWCAPSKGKVHKHPYDCWRFYPDAGEALAEWANAADKPVTLLDSYTDSGQEWGDYVAIYRKD
jgi:ubiquinone/menaquinone biosynthesis C-methylase UbiE